MTDEEQIDGTTHAEKDSSGNIVHKPDVINTEQIGNEYHYAGAYAGADADARLDAALSAVDKGDKIYLENATYSDDRTIARDGIHLQGPSFPTGSNGAELSATWTVTGDGSLVTHIRMVSGGAFDWDSAFSQIGFLNGGGNSITIGASRAIVSNCDNISVTFENGNSGGLVDTCTSTSVTDNDGGNTVGDTT